MKFAIFVYLSNYITQVFFLDANKGIRALLNGGFPVVQVELFDLIILIVTVLLMVTYMPCCYKSKVTKNRIIWWKCLLCGGVFAGCLVVLQELVLPLFGFSNMVSGLNVSTENIPFFYSVMIADFIMAGVLISYYAYMVNKHTKEKFCLEYGILIWCPFDLTMIPLGFGALATIIFIIVSMIAFTAIKFLSEAYM